MDAGLNDPLRRLEMVREATGSPVSIYSRTMFRRISALRGVNCGLFVMLFRSGSVPLIRILEARNHRVKEQRRAAAPSRVRVTTPVTAPASGEPPCYNVNLLKSD